MVHLIRRRWLAVALAFAGVVSPANADAYKPDQHIIVRMGAKGDRRCVVVAVKPQADGSVEYRMKAVDNGEVLTIYDRPGATAKPLPAALAGPAPKPTLATGPLMTFAKPAETVPPAKVPDSPRAQPAVVVRRDPPRPATPVLTDVVMPPSLIGTTLMKADPAPVTVARVAPAKLAMSEPVSMGFVIPVNNSQGTPKAKNFDREERIVTLAEKLKNELRPSAREMAAESLAEGAGAESAAVRSPLLTAAANDPSANVRATCVRCLAMIGVRDNAYSAMIANGKLDPDIRVRIEIDRAEDRAK